MSNPPVRVGILMGSASDAPTMYRASDTLEGLGIGCEMKVASAHRTPERVREYCRTAPERGLKVIIAAAGMSAHLAGVVAALTHLPVLGVPMEGKLAGGLDAVLSMCNMPRGVPVATMSLGSHGAVNAALFAAAILALEDEGVRDRLLAYRQQQSEQTSQEVPPR